MFTSHVSLRVARMVFFIFICGIFLLPNLSTAQTYIGFVNPGFELPGTEKIKGWDGGCADPGWTGSIEDIPGWVSDKIAWDSGVESTDTATDGVWSGFLMGSDTSVYQITDHIIVTGDDITLSVDAKDTWQATVMKIEILGQDTLGVISVLKSTVVDVTSAMTTFSLKFKVSDHPDAISQKLGFALDNVSPQGESWIGIDNVRAINLNPAIEVMNFSFEQPGLEKIKGWDGACADPGWTGLVYDIPYWQSDSTAWDSGVETGWGATDGVWTGFIMGQDTSVCQITNHVIEEGDDIELLIHAKNNWQATLMQLMLFYEENGEKIPLSVEEWELTDAMEELFASFTTANYPEAIGHKLGIALDNVGVPDSWVGIDNVRLNNYKVNAVDGNHTNSKSIDFTLSQNYPNPFNPSTIIYYSLKNSGKVNLSVYDALGREVAVLVNAEQSAGNHEATFNGSVLTSGIYFYRLQQADQTIIKKMTLLK